MFGIPFQILFSLAGPALQPVMAMMLVSQTLEEFTLLLVNDLAFIHIDHL